MQVAIAAQRNEIMDQSSLIRRYQEEISQLRSQLEVAARDRGASITGHDPLHPEVHPLHPYGIPIARSAARTHFGTC